VTTRPEPHSPAPDGYEWHVQPNLDWRIPSAYQRCRQHHCDTPPVADMNRPRYLYRERRSVDRWWAYCAEHMYGNWIEDGKVVCWILRERGEPS
jgi:hypothetical protein